MARQEFTKAIKVAKIKACTADGVIRCEKCKGVTAAPQIDHVNPDGLTGKPTIDNAMLLCGPCHKEKTAIDVANIAKAKRREAKNLGVRNAPTLKSAPFPGKAKREAKPSLPPRQIYQ